MSIITFVGAGTNSTGVNASVTATPHANTAAGDLVLLLASIRNSGGGTVDLPTGWASLMDVGNVRLMGRFWEAGDVAPTVTFTGGVAGADTIAQMATFRGVSLETLTALAASAGQSNGSAQNIGYPALVVPHDRHLVILAAWKQDDATSFSTPATMTGINSVTGLVAGDDASQTWRYVIQTDKADITAGTLTVGGGAAAISRAVLLALKPAPTVTVTEQDVYPPRVLISVTDLTIGDAVQIYRSVSATRTAVRAGASSGVDDAAFLAVDAELPFGVPVSYIVSVNGVELTTAAVTYTLPGGKVVVSDAITGQASEVLIGAWPEMEYARPTTAFVVGGRNVAVSGSLAGFASEIEFLMQTVDSANALLQLLRTATQGIVQIRQLGGYEDVDCYVQVSRARKRRFSQDGSDPKRLVVCTVLEVEPWAPALAARGYTYDDLATVYAPAGTYADLAGDFATYLDLAQAELQ